MELLAQARGDLLEREYLAITESLPRGLGNQTLLFLSLWLSRDREFSGQPIVPDEIAWEVLNEDISGDKLAGFEWIENGCPMDDPE